MGILGYSAIAPALPDLADALGVSDSAIGLLQSAVALPGAALSIVLGWLADRYGRRPVLLAGIALFATAGSAGYVVHDFWALVGLRAVQGVGAAGLLGLPVVLIGDLFEGPARVRVMGYNLASVTASGAVAPIIGGLLARSDPFRPFLLYAIAFGLLPIAALLPIEGRGKPERPIRHAVAAIRQMRERGTLADFVGIVPAVGVVSLIFGGFVFVGTPLHLDAAFGTPVAARGWIIAAASGSAAIFSSQVGRIVARFGASAVFTAAGFATFFGLAVIAVGGSVGLVPLGLAFVGFGIATFYPVMQAAATSAVEADHRGIVVGLFTTSLRTAQGIGPVVASSMFVALGGHAMFAVGSGLALALALWWRPLRRVANRMVAADGPAR